MKGLALFKSRDIEILNLFRKDMLNIYNTNNKIWDFRKLFNCSDEEFKENYGDGITDINLDIETNRFIIYTFAGSKIDISYVLITITRIYVGLVIELELVDKNGDKTNCIIKKGNIY